MSGSGDRVRIEDSPKRVRTYLSGEPIADTRHPKLVWEIPYFPAYYFPRDDVRMEFLIPNGHTRNSASRGVAHTFTVQCQQRELVDAAWHYPESPLEELRGLVRFDWDAMDGWFEEDDEVFVHHGVMQLTYLLVHGSWQGAWCWDGVRAYLEARGHRALAPTLPAHADPSENVAGGYHPRGLRDRRRGGRGDDGRAADARRTQLRWCHHHAARRPLVRPHRAACLRCGVRASRRRVRRRLLPSEFRAGLEQLAAARPDRAVALPWELWRSSFMQTGDEPTARRAYSRLVPEPWAPIFDPVRLSHRASQSVPAAFVVFRDDRTMPTGYWHPQMTGRLAAPMIVELDGDHETMMTAPERLAQVLLELAGGDPG